METPTRSRNEKKWLTAYLCSRTLAQYSTDRYAGGLYCRVRNGTGCDPAAMAVIPKQAIHVEYIIFSIIPKTTQKQTIMTTIGRIPTWMESYNRSRRDHRKTREG